MYSAIIHTLGCKLNQLESEAIASAFTQAGFKLLSETSNDSTTLHIINTCTVTSKADQKARRIIRKTLRDNPNSCVLVTGCYAELDPQEIKALETELAGETNDYGSNKQRLFVFKGKDKGGLLELPSYLKETKKSGAALCNLIRTWSESSQTREQKLFMPAQFSFHSRAFIKIQDGCDRHCTYCRVCLARGPSYSISAEQILNELKSLEEKGYAEAVLTGVNITQYQYNEECKDLSELIKYLLAGTKRIALRLSSLDPDRIDKKFVLALSDKRVRPHFHLSIQSGSVKILSLMGRSYSSDTVKRAVSLLRSVKEDPFLACDIITGFPGETETDFEDTLNLCKAIDFAWIHVFSYSKRPGTPAFSFPDPVCERDAVKRALSLQDLAKQGRRNYAKRWLGRKVTVIIEKGKNEPSFCRGITENYLKILVRCNGEAPLSGSVINCLLLEIPDEKIYKDDVDVIGEEV